MAYGTSLSYAAHARRLVATGAPIVIYDLETTGLDDLGSPAPRVWELAAVRRSAGDRQEASRILNCGVPIPAEANIAGVDPMLPLREGVDPREVLERFARFVDGAILVGHNICGFDNAILLAEYARAGVAAPLSLADKRRCIDTLSLSRAIFPKDEAGSPDRHRLVDMARHLGVPMNGTAHRALADVLTCEGVFDALVARL